MLISIHDMLSKYKVIPSGVIHVGAHYGQEAGEYLGCNFKFMTFIEPCQQAYNEMQRRHHNLIFLNIQYFKNGCGDETKRMTMNVTRQAEGQSNSLLKPKLHLQQHPEVLFTGETEQVEIWRLDDMPIMYRYHFNVLNIDVQGYELQVLRGAEQTLKHIDMVYAEVNRGETYEGNALIEDLDAYLEPYGFVRREVYWPSPNWTWGDAVWTKKKIYRVYAKK